MLLTVTFFRSALFVLAWFFSGCAVTTSPSSSVSKENTSGDSALIPLAISYVFSPDTFSIQQENLLSVRVTNPSGVSVSAAEVTLSLNMPAHGHGLPNSHAVEKTPGEYVFPPIRWNMPGEWRLEIQAKAPEQLGVLSFVRTVQ